MAYSFVTNPSLSTPSPHKPLILNSLRSFLCLVLLISASSLQAEPQSGFGVSLFVVPSYGVEDETDTAASPRFEDETSPAGGVRIDYMFLPEDQPFGLVAFYTFMSDIEITATKNSPRVLVDDDSEEKVTGTFENNESGVELRYFSPNTNMEGLYVGVGISGIGQTLCIGERLLTDFNDCTRGESSSYELAFFPVIGYERGHLSLYARWVPKTEHDHEYDLRIRRDGKTSTETFNQTIESSDYLSIGIGYRFSWLFNAH